MRGLNLLFLLLAGMQLAAPGMGRAGDDRSQREKRLQIAKKFSVYDFEPRGDDPESRDRNGDGWPDYWAPTKDSVPYLHEKIRIVEDYDRPGLYRGVAGHVLRMPYDGTHVAVMTRVPKNVDADLAYEISVWGRTEGLYASIARVVLVWLHVDEVTGERELDRDYISIPRGQVDWPESRLRLRINDLPSGANNVRVICEVLDDPNQPGADRHGKVWFDDIRIESRPKIHIPSVFEEAGEGSEGELVFPPLNFSVKYLGLTDNVPVGTDDALKYQGKSYRRTIEITDMYGDAPTDLDGSPIELDYPRQLDIDPGVARTYTETRKLHLRRLGIYYVVVKLFGYNGRIEARVGQVIGLWRRPAKNVSRDRKSLEAYGTFGLILDSPPDEILRRSGLLPSLIRRAGVYHVKSNVWGPNFKAQGPQPYLQLLNRELRVIRSNGTKIVGVMNDTPLPFRGMGMRRVMKEKTGVLKSYISAVVNNVGPNVEYWQWGAEDDKSFTRHVGLSDGQAANRALAQITGTTIQAIPVDISDSKSVSPPEELAQANMMYVPASLDPYEMVAALSRSIPKTFSLIRNKGIYPSADLLDVSPPEQVAMEDALIKSAGKTVHRYDWLSLQLQSVPRHGRNAIAERRQVEDLARKAILARAVGVKRIFLGSIIGSDGGLMSMDKYGTPIPRPAFMVARTLEEELGGSQYLGSFQLRKFFPNYVFRHRDGKVAVIAVWYTGKDKSAHLDIGTGLDLKVVDMAGNRRSITSGGITVHSVPQLVTGMSVPLARTRMSIRIADEPPLYARHELQRQVISITNYFDQQLPGVMRFKYAADKGFRMERNWTVRPPKVSFNIAAYADDETELNLMEYTVRPDPNTESDGDSGEKFVSITADLNTSVPVRFKLLRKTRVKSELQVEITRLKKAGETRAVHLQMRIRWFPSGNDRRKGGVTLIPYYKKRSALKAPLPKVFVPVYTEKTKDDPAIPVEVVIPRDVGIRQTWVGFEEEGGARFYRTDVTEFMRMAAGEDSGSGAGK